MRVLLDESVPVQLRGALGILDVASVNDPTLGWKGTKDGPLLSKVEGRFDVLITSDRSLLSQQAFQGRSVALLVLPTNRRRDVMALASRIEAALPALRPGRHGVLGRDGIVEWVLTER